ncbi:cytochrome P450 709B2-like [Miscanthus floridulus]|uniref:cytochrome P450 709B2-like n=1 Tax=Miscanthus floridulus TaxID=154761 RepID=UPI003459141A
MDVSIGSVLGALLAVLVSTLLIRVLFLLVWKPYAVSRWFRGQGVGGPSYRFFVGSLPEIKRMKAAGSKIILDVGSHDFIPIVQPQYRKWVADYGKTFLYWFGAVPTICVAEVDLVKQVLAERTGLFPKDYLNANMEALLGKGLVLTNGEEWKRHRKVVHPAFNLDKLKEMSVVMADLAQRMMQQWQSQIQQDTNHEAEIELSSEFSELTSDVIAHTAFGSSYKEGKEVFVAQKELQELAFSASLDIPAPGCLRKLKLPTSKSSRRVEKLDQKVRSMLMAIIEGCLAEKDTNGYGNDLLGLMLEARALEQEGHQMLTTQEIVDECKTFFFAGQDTTSHLLTWTMFLLSRYPEWQHKLREEVLRECGNAVPNPDMVTKLKLVNMVLLESLRLYSPVVLIRRGTGSDIQLGSLRVPKGTMLSIPIALLHRDKDVWGHDADEFNPARFEHGVSKGAGNTPNALLSFSQGPRACIGQNFAMLEARIGIAVILQRFSFELSAKYVHAPKEAITLMPRFGLPMILRNLRD